MKNINTLGMVIWYIDMGTNVLFQHKLHSEHSRNLWEGEKAISRHLWDLVEIVLRTR